MASTRKLVAELFKGPKSSGESQQESFIVEAVEDVRMAIEDVFFDPEDDSRLAFDLADVCAKAVEERLQREYRHAE